MKAKKLVCIISLMLVTSIALTGCKLNFSFNKEKPKSDNTIKMEDYQEDFLPNGSVVTLKEGSKKIMITGRMVTNETSGEMYDYCAVLYPEGAVSSDSFYFFNKDSIDKIYFLGYQDEEEKALAQKIKDYIDNNGKKEEPKIDDPIDIESSNNGYILDANVLNDNKINFICGEDFSSGEYKVYLKSGSGNITVVDSQTFKSESFSFGYGLDTDTKDGKLLSLHDGDEIYMSGDNFKLELRK